jgi:hypothetical protein
MLIYNTSLALGYIVLGIVLDCKSTPVPGLLILGSKKKDSLKLIESLDGAAGSFEVTHG